MRLQFPARIIRNLHANNQADKVQRQSSDFPLYFPPILSSDPVPVADRMFSLSSPVRIRTV